MANGETELASEGGDRQRSTSEILSAIEEGEAMVLHGKLELLRSVRTFLALGFAQSDQKVFIEGGETPKDKDYPCIFVWDLTLRPRSDGNFIVGMAFDRKDLFDGEIHSHPGGADFVQNLFLKMPGVSITFLNDYYVEITIDTNVFDSVLSVAESGSREPQVSGSEVPGELEIADLRREVAGEVVSGDLLTEKIS